MKLTVVRAIPIVLVIGASAFVISGVHRFKTATHGADYVVGEAAWLCFLAAALAVVVLVAVALHRRRAAGVAAACIAALAVAVLAGSSTAANAPGVSVMLSAKGPTIVGPTRWRAGAVDIGVSSKQPDQELVLLHFRPGYTYARFRADGVLAQGRGAAARKALARVLAHTIFDGGVDVFPSTPAKLSVDVRPGTYYLGEMLRRPVLTPIHVVGPAAAARPVSARLLAETDTGYRLAAALPARGTITIRNDGRGMHRLNLIPVKSGTTRAQLAAYIHKTGGRAHAPTPSFARQGRQLGTADLSPGRQMELTYDLPAGEYAILDFGQDMKSGRPYLLEGMYAVVRLR